MDGINALDNDLYGKVLAFYICLTISQEAHLERKKTQSMKTYAAFKYTILEEMIEQDVAMISGHHAVQTHHNNNAKYIIKINKCSFLRSTAATSHKYSHRSRIEKSACLLLAAGYDSLSYFKG